MLNLILSFLKLLCLFLITDMSDSIIDRFNENSLTKGIIINPSANLYLLIRLLINMVFDTSLTNMVACVCLFVE